MWIGLDGNCCVSLSRWPALWVASSSGTCFYGDPTLPARAIHAPWARVCKVGPSHTRVSGQLRRREAGRERDAGEPCRFFSGQGALGQPGAGHGRRGDSPGFQLLSSPPAQFVEGYLKTGTLAWPEEEGERVEGDRRLGLQTSRGGVGGCVRLGAECRAPKTDGAAGSGGARGYFVLSLSTFLPQLRSESGRRGA